MGEFEREDCGNLESAEEFDDLLGAQLRWKAVRSPGRPEAATCDREEAADLEEDGHLEREEELEQREEGHSVVDAPEARFGEVGPEE